VPKDDVFISYSHKDKRWCEELHTHLKPYVRKGAVRIWSDRQISPGSQWFDEIETELEDSKLAILLVSPDFLNSDFIHNYELGPLLKKAEQSAVKILWVPIHASSYDQTALKKYQALHDPAKPLAEMSKAKRNQTWVEICKKIQEEVNRTARHLEAVQQAPPPETAQEDLVATISNSSELLPLPSPQSPPSAASDVLMPASTTEVDPDLSTENRYSRWQRRTDEQLSKKVGNSWQEIFSGPAISRRDGQIRILLQCPLLWNESSQIAPIRGS
jgi:hypothetical protein